MSSFKVEFNEYPDRTIHAQEYAITDGWVEFSSFADGYAIQNASFPANSIRGIVAEQEPEEVAVTKDHTVTIKVMTRDDLAREARESAARHARWGLRG